MTRRESRSTLKVEAYPEYYEVVDGFFRQKEIEDYITKNERREEERQVIMRTESGELRLFKKALQVEARRFFAGQAREFPIIVDEVFRHNPVEIPIEQEVVETVDYNTLTESQILEYFDRLSHNEE